MKAKQANIVKEREKKLAQKQAEKERERQRQMEAKQAEKNKQQRQVSITSIFIKRYTLMSKSFIQKIQALSFNLEDDGDEKEDDDCSWDYHSDDDGSFVPKKKIKKDPTVDTSFLPDREREEEENRLREELQQEWAEQQQKLKEEEIDITFSYWDGSGHRRTVRIKKGICWHLVILVIFLICFLLINVIL